MNNWKPISEAPVNDEIFLCYVPDYSHQYIGLRRHEDGTWLDDLFEQHEPTLFFSGKLPHEVKE